MHKASQSLPEFLGRYADLQAVVFSYLSIPDLRSYALEVQQLRGEAFKLEYDCPAMRHIWDQYLKVCHVFPRALRRHPDHSVRLFHTFFDPEADVQLSSVCYDCLEAFDVAEESDAAYLPLDDGLYRNRCTPCLITHRERYANYVLPMEALFDNIHRVIRLAALEEGGEEPVHEVPWEEFDDQVGGLVMDSDEVFETVDFKGAMSWGITLDNESLFFTANDILVLMDAWYRGHEIVPSPPVFTEAMLAFRAKLVRYREPKVWLQEFQDLDFSPPGVST